MPQLLGGNRTTSSSHCSGIYHQLNIFVDSAALLGWRRGLLSANCVMLNVGKAARNKQLCAPTMLLSLREHTASRDALAPWLLDNIDLTGQHGGLAWI